MSVPETHTPPIQAIQYSPFAGISNLGTRIDPFPSNGSHRPAISLSAMSALESQSLATGREPRIKKMTQRAQQMLEDLQQRHAREKNAKAAASVASQPKLLNNEGDGFLYGPAESYAPPTLTGDDDLDHLRFDDAEAKHILKMLAHRGDGDWQVQFQERQVDLEDLRQARDNPGANILKRKVQGLSSAATKGKARAVDDEHKGEAPASRRETIYTGITIGRTTPAASSHGQNADNIRPTPELQLPKPLPRAKRPAPSQSEQPAKKPRVKREGDRSANTDDTPANADQSAKALPSQPSVRAPGSVATLKKPAAKPSYGGPRPSTNLQLISCGGSTSRRTTPGLANSQPNQPPIKPPAQEQPHQDPPSLDRQEALPHKAQRPRPAQSDTDRLYSVPPQPRAFVFQPPSKKTDPTGRSNGNAAARVSKNASTVGVSHDYRQQPKRASLIATADTRPDVYAPPVVRLITRERTSATVKGSSARRDQPPEPQDGLGVPTDRAGARPDPITRPKPRPKPTPDGAKKHGAPREPAKKPLHVPGPPIDRAGAQPDPITKPKPKRTPDSATKRGVPREPAQEPLPAPQVHKNRAGARTDLIPKPKRAPDAAKKRAAPRELAEEPPVASRVHNGDAGARLNPIPKPKRALDAAKKRAAPRGQAELPSAEHRVAKNRAAARPDPIRKRVSEAAKWRGAARGGVAAPPAEPRMPVNRPARNEQPPARNPQGSPAPADDDDEPEDDETAVEEGNDDEFGATHIFRFASSNTPTVNSYPPEVQPAIKRMAIQAKPWIISCGTFDWREGDPGEEVPTSDTIVARCFARACRELQKRFVFRDDHVKTVNILVTTYRHHTKAVIMALIDKDGEFVGDQPEYNRKLSRWLLPDAFHEGAPESRGDRHPFESSLVSKAIARTLFGPNNYGLKFAELFNPIPLRFLAFICCIMNHVIYCYRSGYFNKKDRLVSTQQELSFQQYLALLGEMHRNRPMALREICGTLYDQARLEAAQAETRVEAPRSPHRWAPDIQEEYISQFKEPTPLPDDEAEDEAPLPRDHEPEGEARVERRKKQANEHARPWPLPQKKPKAHKGKHVVRPGPSDEETTPAPVHNSGAQYRRQAVDDDNDRGEGPSRPYGVHPVDEDEDEDDHGEGPSRPYGTRVVDEDDEDDNLPSPSRAFLQPMSEPSDPELEPSGAEEEGED